MRYIAPMAGWTIQSLIDKKMTVTAHCQRPLCNHHQVLDLQLLKDRLGPDAPAMADDLKPKLKCGKCGEARKIGLIYSPQVTAGAVGNPYLKAKDGR